MKIRKKLHKPVHSLSFQDQENEEPLQDKNVSVMEREEEVIDEVQLKLLLHALRSVREGDFSVRLPVAMEGIMDEVAKVFNDIVVLNENLANELCSFLKERIVFMGGRVII